MGDPGSKKFLTTESGKRIPELDAGAAMFIDKTIAIYGPSRTGKTVITKHIMKTVNGHIDQILVIAPTEPSNRSYEGFVDAPYIHYRMYLPDPKNPKKDDGVKGGLRFLETVWKRQEMMAAIYTRANNSEVLAKLYSRLPKATRAEGLKCIEGINRMREKVIDKVRKMYVGGGDAGRLEEKVKEVNQKFKKMLVQIYKRYITLHHATLWERSDLSEDERYSLNYLNFNPRLLLIFDDCAAQLKPYFNREIFRCFFYQNRHCFTTVIVCCQDDTDLPTNLRKNAFISFFTEPIVCNSNFGRASNGFSKEIKETAAEAANEVFDENNIYQKLAYIREDKNRKFFYYVNFPSPKLFRFGSDAFHELSDSVQNKGVTMDTDNPFYTQFKL